MPLCHSCHTEREEDKLGECLVCRNRICGLGSCTGTCPRCELRFRSNDEQKLLIKNRENQILWASAFLAQQHGLTVEQMIGKTPYDLFPRHIAEQLTEDSATAWKTGQYEAIRRFPIGGVSDYYLSAYQVIDWDGAQVLIVGVYKLTKLLRDRSIDAICHPSFDNLLSGGIMASFTAALLAPVWLPKIISLLY